MDTRTKTDVFQWDVTNWSRSLKVWDKYLSPTGGTALAVGERRGGLALWLAQSGYNVVCTDVREFGPKTRELHTQYGVAANMTYEVADLTKLQYPDDSFDVLTFKSVLGAILSREEQALAVREAYRVLKPGGKLLFAENLAATKIHRFLRQHFVKWREYWRYLDLGEDLDVFSLFSIQEFHTYGVVGLFGRTRFQRRALGLADTVLTPLTPRSWHYILIGACTKAASSRIHLPSPSPSAPSVCVPAQSNGLAEP